MREIDEIVGVDIEPDDIDIIRTEGGAVDRLEGALVGPRLHRDRQHVGVVKLFRDHRSHRHARKTNPNLMPYLKPFLKWNIKKNKKRNE